MLESGSNFWRWTSRKKDLQIPPLVDLLSRSNDVFLFLMKIRNFEFILNIIKADHKPCRPGENQICEWDYLRIIAGTRSSRKMCQYVNRFRKFAVQAGIPGTPDYSYFFTDYSYQSDPMFYNVVRDGWFKAWYKNLRKICVWENFWIFLLFFIFLSK